MSRMMIQNRFLAGLMAIVLTIGGFPFSIPTAEAAVAVQSGVRRRYQSVQHLHLQVVACVRVPTDTPVMPGIVPGPGCGFGLKPVLSPIYLISSY